MEVPWSVSCPGNQGLGLGRHLRHMRPGTENPGVLFPPWAGPRHWSRDKGQEALSNSWSPAWPQGLCMGCSCCLRCSSPEPGLAATYYCLGGHSLMVTSFQKPPNPPTHLPLCCPASSLSHRAITMRFSLHPGAPAPMALITAGLRFG